ncbi:pyruvate, phosphate dikinase [Candidatus Magnetominusculus xianensis]|uniref:Pyruvate, phosphate dikinase n=1 Tax=Candidatus Magnetominusculus xianensis TaxID=1748249 RepID=A0ABR5SEL6_9BACT|nr:pyruvate, phosphate dikinase [Candidatus Magnetominusculus xianensis]KWT82775.1 pyruvate phosphate dikinase [Candidatus Magnetominusculus xianensis]MBF0403464.1 pyruvate, phosphate dikinase [Nitrospirota bacterium]
MSKKKYVYFFGVGKTEGDGTMKDLLGGKGAGLAEMTKLGIPVPPGFTITTETCNDYFNNNSQYPEGMWDEVLTNMKMVEDLMGLKFGDAEKPLLVSVRSGAKFSMPGMMDTVLNLGLTDSTIEGVIKRSNNEKFAYDAYRRFITMFASIVMGVDRMEFEHVLDKKKEKTKVKYDSELSADALKELVKEFKALYKKKVNQDFPQDPMEQLKLAINAVFGSWFGERAKTYRKLNGIADDLGTAVNVCTMVFGNMGDTSGTGVAFTRDPSTGEHKFYGECLINAQGEDVVAGIRTPMKVEELEKPMPDAYKHLMEIYQSLEKHYKDMLDLEFTIEDGKLYMLQVRVGKRTAAAALKIAMDMVDEGMIDKKTAILRVEPQQLDQFLHPMIDPKAKLKKLAKGLPASPGAAVGKAVFTAKEAEEWAEKGEKVLLIRLETSPEDIGGMHAAKGILTARGGMTSHAAVVARGMGKPCVAGCGDLVIDAKKKTCTVKEDVIKEGDWVTINGSTGEIILGETKLIEPSITGDFAKFMDWVDEFKDMGVRANADTPHDAEVALKFGAEGIGLCRTEHMFFEEDRIKAVREMILADDEAGRRKALAKILPMQKKDFKGIFKVMKGKPVTIRLLDPPLHEFLPHADKELNALAKEMGVAASKLKERNELLHEFNPMLGHRGCRLGVTYPEIYEIQVQAIMEAACELQKEGVSVIPEIMIPLVALTAEFTKMKDMTVKICNDVMEKAKVKVEYMVGTMIELPRAAIVADKIVEAGAEFFSFGTNDLTQTTFGLSRDDAGRFLPFYVDHKILPEDPFVSIDIDGVGELIKMGISKGRSAKDKLKVGICGEHGGEAKSVEFCYNAGMNYVSCSPYRVPLARLAAAHSMLKKKGSAASTTK